jgi:glyoxylase-like metal-dependent hydrolase (beta-lactamase superfamily II)
MEGAMGAGQAATDEVRLVPNAGWDARILVCRCGPLVDAFIVVTAHYVVIVDTLINPRTARAQLALAREHLRDGRTLLVVNTHADWDHCWGNQLFAGPEAEAPAPIIATRQCAGRFRSPEALPFLAEMQGREPGRFDDVRYAPPTILFDERLTIDGGDLTLDLFATPGHTPDHLSLHLPEIATLLAGDAAEWPFPFARSAATLPAMRESLVRLAALDPAVVLYCHAPETSGPALLRANIAYFDQLEAHCRAALARGIPAHPAEGEDVATLIAYPVAEALPSGTGMGEVPAFAARGHELQIRMMLEYLSESTAGASR